MKSRSGRRAIKTRTRARKIKRTIKYLMLIAVVFFGSWISIGILRKSVRPFLLYVEESRENRRIERDIAELKSENGVLQRRISYVKTPAGAEAESRALGWVREGEVSLMVIPKDKAE